MAVTKAQMAEQVLRLIAGGDSSPDLKLDVRDVELLIDEALGYVIKASFWENRKSGESEINSDFVTAFEDVEVRQDAKKNLRYSELPAKKIILPNDMGVYQVSRMEDQENTFKRMPNGALGIFKGLPAADLEGEIGYFVEGDRIYYNKNLDFNYQKKVLIKMVVSASSLDDDATLPIPGDMELQLLELIVKFAREQKIAPQDKVPDTSKQT